MVWNTSFSIQVNTLAWPQVKHILNQGTKLKTQGVILAFIR